MSTARDQLRIADQSTAAASRAVPPDPPQEDMRKTAVSGFSGQQQPQRPRTRSKQEGQQRQQ